MKYRESSRRPNRFLLAFLDLVFILALGGFAMLAVTLNMIKPPTPETQQSVNLKAEVVLTMTWPDDSIDDVDTWLLLPNGKKVNFGTKEVEFATLDRDDRGAANDTYAATDGTETRKLIRSNQETITLRALVPGRYVVAAHVFATYHEVAGFKGYKPLPYEAKLEIMRLNPRVETVVVSTVMLTQLAEQKTFVAFDVNEAGQIVNVEQHPDDDIVSKDGK